MVRTKYGKDAPKCLDNKRHQWKRGQDKFRESGICKRCGYDVFDECYRQTLN